MGFGEHMICVLVHTSIGSTRKKEGDAEGDSLMKEGKMRKH